MSTARTVAGVHNPNSFTVQENLQSLYILVKDYGSPIELIVESLTSC